MILTFIAIFISIFAGNIYAHEPHGTDTTRMSVAEMRADSLMDARIAGLQQKEAINYFPNYHPLAVHFPIVMLLLAFGFQILSFFFFKKEFSWTTLLLLAGGFVGGWLASNPFHADPSMLQGKAAEIFDKHDEMATITMAFAPVALIAKIVSHFFLKRKWWMETIVTLLLAGAAVFVSITGDLGAKLVYWEGVGPMGKYLESWQPKKDSSVNTPVIIIKSDTAGKQYKNETGK